MSNIIYPNTTELKKQYNLQYKEMFLKENNLKIGDEITVEFEYQTIHNKYKSREMETFTHKKPGLGILKEDENGYLYAESLDLNTFYIWESRNSKGAYKMVQRKSIRKFHNTFIFN